VLISVPASEDVVSYCNRAVGAYVCLSVCPSTISFPDDNFALQIYLSSRKEETYCFFGIIGSRSRSPGGTT
jgi:hypothetical protein